MQIPPGTNRQLVIFIFYGKAVHCQLVTWQRCSPQNYLEPGSSTDGRAVFSGARRSPSCPAATPPRTAAWLPATGHRPHASRVTDSLSPRNNCKSGGWSVSQSILIFCIWGTWEATQLVSDRHRLCGEAKVPRSGLLRGPAAPRAPGRRAPPRAPGQSGSALRHREGTLGLRSH